MRTRSFSVSVWWPQRRPILPLVLLCGVALSLLTIFWLTTRLSANENQPDGLGSLAGQVRDANGQPLAGIQVILWVTPPSSADNWWYSRITTTEADGSYRFASLPPGVYRISGQDLQRRYGQRFYPAARTVQIAQDLVVAGNFVTGINLTLQPAGRIIATVTATSAYTLAYTMIEVRQLITTTGGSYWERLYQAYVTTANNVFTVTGLAADTYRVCGYGFGPNLSAYECYDNVYDVAEATDLTLTAGGTISNVAIVLGDGANYGQIKGRVTAADDKPLANINVYAYRVAEDGLLRSAASNRWRSAMTTRAPNLPAAPLAPGNDYYGYLQAITDANGDYTLATLPAGKYQLHFVDPEGNYAFEYYPNQWRLQDATIFEVAAQAVISSVNNQLAAAGRISGIVTLADQPTPDTNVLAERKADDGSWQPVMQVRTNPNTGAYTIGGLPAGIYRISAQAQIADYLSYGYSIHYPFGVYGGATLEQATALTLANGTTATNINIVLSPLLYEGGLSGRVTANGQPLAGAKVALYLPGGGGCCGYGAPAPRLYTFTDAAGRYRFDGLGSSTFALGASDPAGIYATTYYSNETSLWEVQYVNIPNDQVLTDYNLDLPRAGAISGVVRQRNNKPVAGLYVTLYDLREDFFRLIPVPTESRTDDSGRYTITGVHPGRYYVCFTGATYPIRVECYGNPDATFEIRGTPVMVTAGTTATNIDLLWGPDRQLYLPLVSKQ